MNSSSATSTAGGGGGGGHEMTGRVVRLHFRCHAALPIGSFLRVTGSTLWAPGTAAGLGPGDPSDAAANTSDDVPDVSGGGGNSAGADGAVIPVSALYTSSVEMVTTPEDYPVWRTRKPVVVVWHHSHKHHQHHYYRYLVVSPGGGVREFRAANNVNNVNNNNNNDIDMETDMDDYPTMVSTSNEGTGQTVVMQWEDPFNSLLSSSSSSADNRDKESSMNTNTNRSSSSAVSLTSSIAGGVVTKANYRNLPYRTIDIDAQQQSFNAEASKVKLDRWNMPDDMTFRPYLIRDAIHQENRRKMQPRLSNVTDYSASGSNHSSNHHHHNHHHNDSGMDGPSSGTTKSGSGQSSGTATPPTFSTANRLFFICFHLPVVVVQNQSTGQWRASWSESILAKSEGSQILSTYEHYWVGTVSTHPPLKTEADKEAVRAILEEMHCIPLFLDAELVKSHYYGFCKQVLWPAFHNIDLLDMSTCGWLSDRDSGASDWDQGRLDNWWNAYKQVNAEFMNVLTGLVRNGDILWIHDYHLSLLPEHLTAWEMEKFGRRVTRKVFFLHIPFPTSQIFRELECGEQILQGMLHADVVGFHAFDHARHFLNAAKRILGLNYESLAGGLIGVSFQGQTVLVSMSNVSIEPRMADAALMLPSVEAGRNELKKKHEGRIIIGGLDIGQRLSGASLKLLAYERLLQDYPSWQSKVVMVERIILPGSREMDEAVTSREIRSLVKRIVDKFGPAVIDYKEFLGTSLPMDQRLALWRASDVLMSTPIREGLNHWPMEYIYSHKAPQEPGVVITSEFSAISSILNGALRVNPFDIQMTITTIDKALSMTNREREGRRYRDIDFVSGSPSDKWVKNVLRDLKDATSRQPSMSEASSQVSTPMSTPTPSRKELIDSTAAFLSHEESLAFTHLSMRALKRAYDTTSRRVIILDFNGTIVLKEPPGKYLKREILGTSGNKPPPDVLEALSILCQNPSNIVYVVSGDSSENVLSALGGIPKLGLAVSNGAQFSPPLMSGESERKWLNFDLGVDWDAVKRVALPVLSKYTARSNGSFVKLTSFSIGWSYYSCDPEWGSLQAAHLVLELENELRAFDVRFVTLKGIVEIVPRRLNKGLIVKKLLRDTSFSKEGCDFCLCFGDDISDEKMFTSVFSHIAEIGYDTTSKPGPPVMRADGSLVDEPQEPEKTVVKDPLYSFTVAVGKKSSHASSYVNDAQEVANALVMLARGEFPAGGVPVWSRENASHLFA